MKSIAFKSGILFTAAVLVTLSSRLESQADFDSFFSKFEAAVMGADTYQLQNLMADKFDFMGITDSSPQDVFKGLGSGQWPNLQLAVKNKVFVTQPYNGKPARFLRCTPPTAHNNCYVIFQNDSSGHWRWKAMVMPEK
jgi:hypothetical protein